ncbi:Pf11-1 protein [Planoprotostelium fungivorum]|uniref:Pf11-1 protein n=1 Tax=Planoprotostelium fungivorum TaxID=1890364 RepID=A0A2P6MUF5_9EUKA|nr:Pf11-1 protein [Planoprotostelium fungivorum]
MQATNVQVTEATIRTETVAPLKTEVIQKETVVHEHIHPVMKEEIQPVIYREREQLAVKQVTERLHETEIKPTLVEKRELAAEVREVMVEKAAPIPVNYVAPTVDVDATLRSQVVHAPIVNEVIKKTIIEEVQPVLEKDIIQTTLIQETKNIYEKVVEAPVLQRELLVERELGVKGGSMEALAAQGFPVPVVHKAL